MGKIRHHLYEANPVLITSFRRQDMMRMIWEGKSTLSAITRLGKVEYYFVHLGSSRHCEGMEAFDTFQI